MPPHMCAYAGLHFQKQQRDNLTLVATGIISSLNLPEAVAAAAFL